MNDKARLTVFGSGLMLCGLAVALPGCSKLVDKLAERAQDAIEPQVAAVEAKVAEPAATPAATRDEQVADKLSHYIECLNGLSRGVFNSRDRYLSWASKDGVTGKERNVYGLYELSDPKYCFKDLEEAKAKPPNLPEIERAAEKYQAAYQALQAKVKPVYTYYDQNDYKDDAFAKGKEVHASLLAAFSDFENVNKTFENLVVTLNEEVAARELERVSKDPTRQLEFRGRKLASAAKDVVKASNVETLKELDAVIYASKVENLSAAMTDLETYIASHASEAEKAQNEDRMLSDGKELQKAAKELLRRKRENKDFNKEFFARNAPQMVEGHPAQVIEKFNSFIRASNSARY
jgi:hypothetical protein